MLFTQLLKQYTMTLFDYNLCPNGIFPFLPYFRHARRHYDGSRRRPHPFGRCLFHLWQKQMLFGKYDDLGRVCCSYLFQRTETHSGKHKTPEVVEGGKGQLSWVQCLVISSVC